MIDTKELRRLAQAVSEWSNCNQAWLDQSEDVPAATVGHIDEDGNTYPIATIDCDQYYAAHQSLPLAKFYAAANPSVISELLDRLEAAEKERDWHAERCEDAMNECDALRAKIERMEQQEPARLVTPTAYRWRRRGSVMWQYGELTEETVQVAKEHNHEVQSLGVLPGAQPKPDCGEAGHDEGRCGNRQCLPGAQTQGEWK